MISCSWFTDLSWWRNLLNSMKIWAMPCRDTQDRWIIVKSSDKTRSTGRGSGKPLQYSWDEKAMKNMKRQKDDTSRWVPPGCKVSGMLLGRSGGPLLIAPERMSQWAKVETMSISSLIPKMLIFTLVIFCLTNLPWFMDLTFQIPMQYHFLQLWTLLSPPDTFSCGYVWWWK